jgi:hypothetical protein
VAVSRAADRLIISRAGDPSPFLSCAQQCRSLLFNDFEEAA